MSTTPAATISRPWRRLLRFSVRGMIVVVLVIAGWLGWLVRSAHVQRDAVAAIRTPGGSVTYDWARQPDRLISRLRRLTPRWLVDLIGVDYFGHPTDARIVASSISTDDALREVGRLTQLERLDIHGLSPVSDSLAHLEGLSHLTELCLSTMPVTDEGMVHLKGLTNLTVLRLEDTKITDAGLTHLNSLKNLQILDVSVTRVSDSGLAQLKGLSSLYSLSLGRTEITDSGLDHLKGLTKLSTLDLRGTPVTDVGVNELQQALPRLMIYR